jgi:hypothetical protein
VRGKAFPSMMTDLFAEAGGQEGAFTGVFEWGFFVLGQSCLQNSSRALTAAKGP